MRVASVGRVKSLGLLRCLKHLYALDIGPRFHGISETIIFTAYNIVRYAFGWSVCLIIMSVVRTCRALTHWFSMCTSHAFYLGTTVSLICNRCRLRCS